LREAFEFFGEILHDDYIMVGYRFIVFSQHEKVPCAQMDIEPT